MLNLGLGDAITASPTYINLMRQSVIRRISAPLGPCHVKRLDFVFWDVPECVVVLMISVQPLMQCYVWIIAHIPLANQPNPKVVESMASSSSHCSWSHVLRDNNLHRPTDIPQQLYFHACLSYIFRCHSMQWSPQGRCSRHGRAT